MKNFFKFLISLTLFIFAISPASNGLAAFAGIPNVAAATVLVMGVLLIAVFQKKRNTNTFIHACGVEKEMWVDYIIKRFWKDNSFLQYAYNDDQYVLAGKVVHIPQPGAKPLVIKNRNSFPAAAVRRTDGDITYALDEYSTDPTHVQNAETIEPSYNKLDDVYGDHLAAITELVADDMLLKWATGLPAGSFLKTTGAAAAATLPGATGNRNVAVHKDIRAINLFFNTKNVTKTDRYGLLEENMADQIFDSLSDTQYRTFTEYADATTGVLGKLYGFNLMTRSSIAVAKADNTVAALGAGVLATDSQASIFWQKNSVTRALGEVKVFDDTDNPLYYGDIISSLLRAGGRRRRSDDLGVALLVPATPAG